MKKRFIDNYLSTLAGVAILGLGGIMFYQSKIDYVAFGIIAAFGLAVAGVKYKKEV